MRKSKGRAEERAQRWREVWREWKAREGERVGREIRVWRREDAGK